MKSTTNTKYEPTIRNKQRWAARPITGLLRPVGDDLVTARTETVISLGNIILRECTFNGAHVLDVNGQVTMNADGNLTNATGTYVLP
jgi:hypothetical protein